MRAIPSLIASLAIVTACGRLTTTPSTQAVQLQIGQAAMVAGSSVRVQFVRAADSRCPSDVVCITAGEAVVEIVFSGSGPAQTSTLRLGQKAVTATYGGLVFEATALDPYPSRQPALAQTVTLRVTASRAQSSTTRVARPLARTITVALSGRRAEPDARQQRGNR